MPDAPDDPTESEIAGAADKVETMLRGSHPSVNIFFQPDNLGALPALWLQAKLTISLTSIQEKFAKLFMTIAAELWLRGRIDTLETVFQAAARNFTIRLAEALAKYLCSLIGAQRYWPPRNRMPAVRHILVSADIVRVGGANQPHSRPNAGIDLASGVSALLAWFPPVGRVRLHRVSWVRLGATQLPQEVTIQCLPGSGRHTIWWWWPSATSS